MTVGSSFKPVHDSAIAQMNSGNNLRVAAFDHVRGLAVVFMIISPKKIPAANAPLEGFFSVDGCGEIYKLNYYTLKKYFRGETEFLKAVKAMEDKVLFTAAGKTTKVNELYKKLVSTVNE